MEKAEDPQKKMKRVRDYFSIEEDEALKILHQTFGNNWVKISENLQTKTPRQCKDRWLLYLAPGRNNTPFTPEEIFRLEKLVAKYGHQWRVFSCCFNRTEVQIKNMWRVLERKKKAAEKQNAQIKIIPKQVQLPDKDKRSFPEPKHMYSSTNKFNSQNSQLNLSNNDQGLSSFPNIINYSNVIMLPNICKSLTPLMPVTDFIRSINTNI